MKILVLSGKVQFSFSRTSIDKILILLGRLGIRLLSGPATGEVTVIYHF